MKLQQGLAPSEMGSAVNLRHENHDPTCAIFLKRVPKEQGPKNKEPRQVGPGGVL
jgi:hypothetical protein